MVYKSVANGYENRTKTEKKKKIHENHDMTTEKERCLKCTERSICVCV